MDSPEIFSWMPRIVVGARSASEIYVLWQEIVFSGGTHGGEIFIARSVDGGRIFSPPTNLSNTRAGAGKGRLTEERWDNGSLDWRRVPTARCTRPGPSTKGGSGWLARPIAARASLGRCTSPAARERPRAPRRSPSAPRARVHLAWAVGEDPAADIHVTRSLDGGRIRRPYGGRRERGTLGRTQHRRGRSRSPPRRVCASTRECVALPRPLFPLSGRRRDVSTSRAILGGNARAAASFPRLSVADEDRVFVLAERITGRADRPRGLLLTHSSDGGRRFAPPSLVPGSVPPPGAFNGSLQSSLMAKLAVDDAGSIAVVDSTFRRGDASHVWLLRGGPEAR